MDNFIERKDGQLVEPMQALALGILLRVILELVHFTQLGKKHFEIIIEKLENEMPDSLEMLQKFRKIVLESEIGLAGIPMSAKDEENNDVKK